MLKAKFFHVLERLTVKFLLWKGLLYQIDYNLKVRLILWGHTMATSILYLVSTIKKIMNSVIFLWNWQITALKLLFPIESYKSSRFCYRVYHVSRLWFWNIRFWISCVLCFSASSIYMNIKLNTATLNLWTCWWGDIFTVNLLTLGNQKFFKTQLLLHKVLKGQFFICRLRCYKVSLTLSLLICGLWVFCSMSS